MDVNFRRKERKKVQDTNVVVMDYAKVTVGRKPIMNFVTFILFLFRNLVCNLGEIKLKRKGYKIT